MIARRLLLVGPALLSVAGCGGPPAPAVVELSIRASTDVNPNPAGTPVSVAVRLYSLMGRGRFMSADAYALMDREKATLGDESAGSEELVLRPGESAISHIVAQARRAIPRRRRAVSRNRPCSMASHSPDRRDRTDQACAHH